MKPESMKAGHRYVVRYVIPTEILSLSSGTFFDTLIRIGWRDEDQEILWSWWEKQPILALKDIISVTVWKR